ncbi:MAG: polysaccharide ABC transporter ATP-binding protein [Planctomycetaceae bacterium]|jgi:lipopolysaccharide transport system ATP-binding protein|nr:ATP-binding cassette domain-containing protein [Phycisphaerales bacterium]MCE2653083.1 polysaccharide ABC transporter ATP-binding protein [Planctomycetaceae bacterium]
MSDTIISVENISKVYRLAHEGARPDSFRELITSTLTAPFRRLRALGGATTADTEEFWALKDVSFEVKRGEVVGIIGRNGAGKSTLLKVLSRIVEPTAGRIRMTGRVASLLEVGTGFHPELTGRENIYMNGAILGMKRREIAAKFDEIVAFAEVEKFLDTPVKRYSSGMYVRLAFAVAAHLDPEILIVDEVLAVGDADFQRKCMGKMQDVARGTGRTVLFVSHNIAAIRTLCTTAITLRHGNIAHAGSVEHAIARYLDSGGHANGTVWEEDSGDLSATQRAKPVRITRAALHLFGQQPRLTLRLHIDIHTNDLQARPSFVAADILDPTGTAIMQAIPSLLPFINPDTRTGHFSFDIDLPPLIPGTYSITLWIGPHNTSTYDTVHRALAFTIDSTPQPGRTFPHTADHGYIAPTASLTHGSMPNHGLNNS